MDLKYFLGFYLNEVKNDIEKEYTIKTIKVLSPPSKDIEHNNDSRIVKIKLVSNTDLEILVCRTL